MHMKKVFKIILISLIILVAACLIIFLVNFQWIRTDKKIFSVGEKIIPSFFDFRLYRCEYDGDKIEFYRQKDNQWELIEEFPNSEFCLDGKLIISLTPMCCEECKIFNEPIEKGHFSKELKILERKPIDEVCQNIPNYKYYQQFKTKSLPSYISHPAPPGLYKIKYGKAKAIFEIK